MKACLHRSSCDFVHVVYFVDVQGTIPNRADASAARKNLATLIFTALAIRLIPAVLLYGTEDITIQQLLVREMTLGHNVYATGYMKWPPLCLGEFAISQAFSVYLHLPLYFALKLVPIAADVLIAVVIYLWMLRRGQSAFRTAMFYALNPISVYVVAFHGQIDTFAVLCCFLAVLALEGAKTNRFGFWLSLGALAKTWPLILLPALLKNVKSQRKRLFVAILICGPWVASMAFVLHLLPRESASILGYHSNSVSWGITGLMTIIPAESIVHLASLLFFGAMLASYVTAWRFTSSPLHISCAVILSFYVFAPGFGTQYLAWIIPFALLVDRRSCTRFVLIASLIIAAQSILRPYNGTFLQALGAPSRYAGELLGPRLLRTPNFFAAYGKYLDSLITWLMSLPLWTFCACWWWKEHHQIVRTNDRTATVPQPAS